MQPMKPARRLCACLHPVLLSCVLALPCRGQTVAYSAPTTGPAPYEVYEVTPSRAFAFGTGEAEVFSATRYRF